MYLCEVVTQISLVNKFYFQTLDLHKTYMLLYSIKHVSIILIVC